DGRFDNLRRPIAGRPGGGDASRFLQLRRTRFDGDDRGEPAPPLRSPPGPFYPPVIGPAPALGAVSRDRLPRPRERAERVGGQRDGTGEGAGYGGNRRPTAPSPRARDSHGGDDGAPADADGEPVLGAFSDASQKRASAKRR